MCGLMSFLRDTLFYKELFCKGVSSETERKVIHQINLRVQSYNLFFETRTTEEPQRYY